jgi:hypothetical protein
VNPLLIAWALLMLLAIALVAGVLLSQDRDIRKLAEWCDELTASVNFLANEQPREETPTRIPNRYKPSRTGPL